MSDNERNDLIEEIARRIDQRAENWSQRRNDFSMLYEAECATIAALVRSFASDNPGNVHAGA
jgi:hypothetical protein